MAGEIVKLGLISDQEYLTLLSKLTSNGGATLQQCELLCQLVEAHEICASTRSLADDQLILENYLKIGKKWLFPHLEKMISQCSLSNMLHSIIFPYEVCESQLRKDVTCCCVTQSATAHSSEAGQSHSTATDQVTKILRLFKVIVIILRKSAHLTETDQSLGVLIQDSIIPFIMQVLKVIAQTLCCPQLESTVEEDQHKVKVLGLVFAMLMGEGEAWVMHFPSIQQSVHNVIKASLASVETVHNVDVVALLLTYVLQPYLEIKDENKSWLICELWDIVKNFYNYSGFFIIEEKNSAGYLILCFMSGYMFDRKYFDMVGCDEAFWKVIQHGLIHANPLTRKRSQYILKRCIDYCSSPELPADTELKCFYWNDKHKKQLEEIWTNYFLLLETLEEKQAHVLRPVLAKFSNLIHMCHTGNDHQLLHVTWSLVIFCRLFHHDNKNIRLWGVMHYLQLTLPMEILSAGVLSFTTLHLLPALADYSLYSRDQEQQSQPLSRVGNQLTAFLQNIIDILDVNAMNTFMTSLLMSIFDGRMWGAVPLYYLLHSLAHLSPTSSWSYRDAKKAVSSYEACLSTQEVVVRSASQCDFLKAIFKHLSPETTLLELCSIIVCFRREESWCQGTSVWQHIFSSIDALQEPWPLRIHSVQDAIHTALHSSSDINPPYVVAVALNLVFEKLMLLPELSERQPYLTVLSPLTTFLKDCHLRPYLDQGKYTWSLNVINLTFKILCNVPAGLQSVPEGCRRLLASCLAESVDTIIQRFLRDLPTFTQPYHIDLVTLYLSVFTNCNLLTIRPVLLSHYPEVFNICKRLLVEENPVQVSYGVLLLEHLLHHYYDDAAEAIKREMTEQVRSKVVRGLHNLVSQLHVDGYHSSDFNKRLLQEVSRSSWSTVCFFVTKVQDGVDGKVGERVQGEVVCLLPETITTAGHHTIHLVFQTAVQLAPAIFKSGRWTEVVEGMWSAAGEFRSGCDLYRSLIGLLTKLVLHPHAVANPQCHALIVQICESILASGEGAQGTAPLLASSFVSTLVKTAGEGEAPWLSDGGKLLVWQVLVPLLMHGTVYRKQYKVIHDTMQVIQAAGDSYSTNTLLQSSLMASNHTRAISLRALLYLDRGRAWDRAFARVVVEGIQHHYACCHGHRRDFSNSQNHRYKTRLLQAFLILLPLLDKEGSEGELRWLCEGLTSDHQQPSVRYMLEWGAALLTLTHSHLYPHLLTHFQEGTRKRLGCVGSFLAALTLVACSCEDVQVLSQALQHTLPWCMAQHFNTRLYAQVSLRKMWQHCEVRQVDEVLEKYGPVQQCLELVVQQGTAARNTLNMLNDFYFKVFHPIQHYTVQTILHDLPCLSLLADDEWIKPEWLVEVVDVVAVPIQCSLPLHNTDSVLANSLPAPWVVKAAGEQSLYEEKEAPHHSVSNVQKKITPWKSMTREITGHVDQLTERSTGTRGGLVLVASLLDKAPNLGGLCRTCEVFSVREYVVPSLTLRDHPAFNSLSLTAHQWVPMKEVKPEGLTEYLKGLQGEGYTLVAAEQTASSISLSQYKFPERTVVVLGNEKEGIPCELLQLFDVCVEIPQTGMIRSLNVHVSGALFIWEYTRQHLPPHPAIQLHTH